MAVTADGLNSRRRGASRAKRAMQTLGFVALLALGVVAGLTASGTYAGNPGNLVGTEAAIADAPALANALDPCDSVWSVVSSPNVGTGNNSLGGVAVLSASDVWAVGSYANGSVNQTLVEHWNGAGWSVVPSPNYCCYDNYLYGVAAVSANDVWAVGYYRNNSNVSQTLIEHWDGTAWSVVSSLNPMAANYLYGVAAVSATDVWAVGLADNQTLTEHWDGTAWSVVPSPNPDTQLNILVQVTAVSANDVWAVGYHYTNPPPVRTLVEHWDGTAWSVVPSPNHGEIDNYLYGVAAVSANDVWAVGYYFDGTLHILQTLTEHWDGTEWSVVPSLNVGTNNTYLTRVAVVSANDVWATGVYQNGTGPFQTLIEHWNGTAWSVVPSSDPGSLSQFYGVAAVSANDVWAVGKYDNGGASGTLVERYASPCGTPTSTPTDTPIPSATAVIFGHLTWQYVAVENQPSVTGTLSLCVSGALRNYTFHTDTIGNFTITTNLPDGTYNWMTKGATHISNASPSDGAALVISGGQATQEFGTQYGGDVNNTNLVNAQDFTLLKGSFGRSEGQQGYFARADLNYNHVVNSSDFAILKNNYGRPGHSISCP